MWWNLKNLPLSSNADSEIEILPRFTPQIAKYDLPQIVCTIYPPPEITREDLPLKLPSTIYPPQIVQFWAKFQTHNIMLCFTKVFSAKDQWWLFFSVFTFIIPLVFKGFSFATEFCFYET